MERLIRHSGWGRFGRLKLCMCPHVVSHVYWYMYTLCSPTIKLAPLVCVCVHLRCTCIYSVAVSTHNVVVDLHNVIDYTIMKKLPSINFV